MNSPSSNCHGNFEKEPKFIEDHEYSVPGHKTDFSLSEKIRRYRQMKIPYNEELRP